MSVVNLPADFRRTWKRLESRLFAVEGRARSVSERGATVEAVQFSTKGQLTNWNLPVGSYGKCPWFAEFTAGPSQTWEVQALAYLDTSVAAWGSVVGRVVVTDDQDAALPNYTEWQTRVGIPLNSAVPAQTLAVPYRFITQGDFAPDTRVRLHFELNATQATFAYRDGSLFRLLGHRIK